MSDVGDLMVNGPHPLPTAVIRRAMETVLRRESRSASVSITFLGPAAMRRFNHEHKGHDRPTDVISFALPQPDGSLVGDIYICRWMAVREARSRDVPVRQELLRLMIHGVLHVLGHDHPEGHGRAESEMWRLQERYLAEIE